MAHLGQSAFLESGKIHPVKTNGAAGWPISSAGHAGPSHPDLLAGVSLQTVLALKFRAG